MGQAQEMVRQKEMALVKADIARVQSGQTQMWDWMWHPEQQLLVKMKNSVHITRYYQDAQGMNHDVYGEKGFRHLRPGPELLKIAEDQQAADRAAEAREEEMEAAKRQAKVAQGDAVIENAQLRKQLAQRDGARK